jgi:hypothetical protein
MKTSLKFFLLGAVINIMTAPFSFSQSDIGSEYHLTSKNSFELKLSDNPAMDRFNLRENANTGYFFKTIDTLRSDTVKPKTVKKFKMKKSPTKAVLLSAVLPGAGQFYNGSYWKIPIVTGLVGYFGYEYFRNNNLYKDNRELYVNSQTPENPDGDQNYKTLREFYRDQRDDFVWYFLIVYVLNMVDAYVDAHLFDFDVSEEKLSRYNDAGKLYRLKFNLKF